MTDLTVPPSVYRVHLAGRLGEIGALIMANRLPMPAPNRPPSINFDLGDDVAAVEQVATALGVEPQQYGPRVQASWPPIHERGDGLPFATWVAHIPADRAGFEFSREMAPEDGDLTQPGRIEPHTGGVTDGGLVDETPSETGERVEVGADGCGCPVTEEVRANGSSIDGTERVEHRPKCWARPDVIPPTDPDDLPRCCFPRTGEAHTAACAVGGDL